MTTEAYNSNVTEKDFNAVMEEIHTEPKAPQKWAVQVYDTDSCEWVFDDQCQPTIRKSDAEDDARQIKRKCCYPVRTRVVKW